MSAVGSASGRPSPESTDLPETPAAREIDDLLPEQLSVTAVANESSGHTDVDEESIQLEVEQLMNVTLNGLYTAVQDKKTVVQALNKLLRRKYRVTLKGIGFDDDGEMYVVFNEFNQNISRRKCKWDKEYYSLRETLEWALTHREASLQWTLDYWKRDFA